jgi:AAA15 family ATPase/GTPase
MKNFIKLIKAEIKNIKNVKHGIIDFKTHITGIYGQNGSGKTALVDSTSILKAYLLGRKLDSFYDLINVETKTCNLNFTFKAEIDEKKYKIFLEITLKKIKKIIENEEVNGVIVDKETIKYSEIIDKKITGKKILIGTTKKELLKTVETFGKLISEYQLELMLGKRLAEENSLSFLFAKDLIEILEREKENYQEVLSVLMSLKKFGTVDLIVITNENLGIINMNNVFPLNVRTNKSFGSFLITEQNIVIDEKMCDELHRVIEQINVVLHSIIPNMSLDLFEKNKEFVEKNRINVVFQLISIRNGKKIPFKNESEGIKKIVSILSAVIATYHNREICLVVDELDSGIFEYLLGELLSILDEGIKGQLIFTSHNLRVLEKLDKDSLVFTTVNEENRYLRLKNIKPSNNLRDVYIREMTMQEQNEILYEETNNGDIEFALYEAGVLDAKK